jgi:hypothetical protein
VSYDWVIDADGTMHRVDANGNPTGDPIVIQSWSLQASGGFCAPATPMYYPLTLRVPSFYERAGKPKVDPDEDVPMFNRMPEEAKSAEFVFGSDEWKAHQRASVLAHSYDEHLQACHTADVRRARMERAAEAEIVNRDVDRLLYEMEHLERDMKREDADRRNREALAGLREIGDLARNDFTFFHESFAGLMGVPRPIVVRLPYGDLDLGITRAPGGPNRSGRRAKVKAPTKRRKRPPSSQPSCHHGNLKGSCRQCW